MAASGVNQVLFQRCSNIQKPELADGIVKMASEQDGTVQTFNLVLTLAMAWLAFLVLFPNAV